MLQIIILLGLFINQIFSFKAYYSIYNNVPFLTKCYGSGKTVEVKFEPSGKVVMAEQGDRIDDVAKKNGINIPFKCKQVHFLYTL